LEEFMNPSLSMRMALAVVALGLAAPVFASDATRDLRDPAGAGAQVATPKQQEEVARCACTHCGTHRGQAHQTTSRDETGPSSAPTAGMRSGRR
jgi:hypothetical protein